MERRKKILNIILEQGILPLYFHPDAAVSIEVLKALYRAGIRAVEYTNRGETAIENFLQMRKIVDKELHDMHLGVGAIKNKIDATEYINEGADFIVCPGVTKDIASVVHYNNLLWIPGCMTATEIILAEDLGAKLIKLFPGDLLGASYITAIKEIFPELLFMSTGEAELNEATINASFESGAAVAGIGNQFFINNLSGPDDYTRI